MFGLKRPPYTLNCPKCKAQTIRDEQWDAYYCAVCNEWLEKQCSLVPTDGCYFHCWDRPAKPLPFLKVIK